MDDVLDYLYGPIDSVEVAFDYLDKAVSEGRLVALSPGSKAMAEVRAVWNVKMHLTQAAMAFVSYTDTMKSKASLRFGKDSDTYKEVDSLFSASFDSSLSYRVACAVRNVLAHSDENVVNGELILAGGPGQPGVLMRINKKLFCGNSRISPKTRKEVESIKGGDIEVLLVMGNLLPILRDLDRRLKDIIFHDIETSQRVIRRYLDEASRHGGLPQVLRNNVKGYAKFTVIPDEVAAFVSDANMLNAA